MKAGKQFRQMVEQNNPLQIPGIINAYSAMMAEKIGFQALYLSGGGVANNTYGMPDTGITNLTDVHAVVEPIVAACSLPLLVDIDTGFGDAHGIARTIKTMQQAGAAAVHIEDQIEAKKCGHLDGKKLVSTAEMCDRIKACVDARTDESFVIMARTDAYALDGLQPTIERAIAFQEAGADMLFIEALPDIDLYQQFTKQLKAPILANMTEFGKTPLYTAQELAEQGVAMVLYPRTIDRIMSKVAYQTMQTLLDSGTQKLLLPQMQTRAELYEILDYDPKK